MSTRKLAALDKKIAASGAALLAHTDRATATKMTDAHNALLNKRALLMQQLERKQ